MKVVAYGNGIKVVGVVVVAVVCLDDLRVPFCRVPTPGGPGMPCHSALQGCPLLPSRSVPCSYRLSAVSRTGPNTPKIIALLLTKNRQNITRW